MNAAETPLKSSPEEPLAQAEPSPETERTDGVPELVVMMRELGFMQEDLAIEPEAGFVHYNTVACAAYLLQEAVGSEKRQYWFEWDWSRGIITTDVPTVFYTDDIKEIEAAWNKPVEWTDARVDALDVVRKLLDPPPHFSGERVDWLALVATVHRTEPGFHVCSNRLDLCHSDSKNSPLWDMVKGSASRVDPQDLIDTAYGRLIRLNLGSEYWNTDFSDRRFDTLVARATRTYPGGDVDLDLHVGKTVRKAAYAHMRDTRSL